MPELPDIEVFTRNLDALFAGKKLERIKIVNAAKLPHKTAIYTKALTGRKLKRVYRSGKEMRFDFSGKTLLGLHLMLTGDVFVFQKKNKRRKSTIAEFYFSGGIGLELTDRMKNAFITIGPIDKKGVDALSPDLNFRYLKRVFHRKRMVKSLMTDQDIIRGLGNSYTDEILWEARINPYSIAQAIPDEKLKLLARVIKKLLKKEIVNIQKALQGKVNGEVKDFLKIHTSKIPESPTGAPIIIDKKGMMKTYYTREQVLYT